MKRAIGSLLFIFACIIPTSVLASEIKGDTSKWFTKKENNKFSPVKVF